MNNYPEILLIFNYDTGKWHLKKAVTIRLYNGDIVTIPVDFNTDLGTVPWLARLVINPSGYAVLAFIVHDYLYYTGYFLKKGYSDFEARSMSDTAEWHIINDLLSDKIPRWKNNMIWLGGRIGGKKYWKKYRILPQSKKQMVG